ncbi:hypothetical protein VNI00_009937 [Paramarasmius palmivorus]|uniref:C2H2-type domain-containing protein n=1 Tax=Paramarasmius palmivorus TaxID=297713 RepID=A0AAW0CKQ1_9AGAR
MKASMGSTGLFLTCQWQGCDNPSSYPEDHVSEHSLSSLPCPYEGCERAFREPGLLVDHTCYEHKSSRLKPSADPFVPSTDMPPPAPDDTLPSYMTVTRNIMPCQILAETHGNIGPQVLHSVMPVKLSNYGDLNDEYDFVSERPMASYIPSEPANIQGMDDLDCSKVSALVQNGLRLW